LLLAAGLLCATTVPAAKRAPDAPNGGPAPAPLRADAFAAELLTRRHRKLYEHGATLSRASAQERHAVRIAAKRLRYAADFFAPLFARRRSRAYLETLSELQDVLGQFNDAATASALATELARAKDETAAAAIRGWAAAQGVALAPRLAKAWGRFQACEPFWH
jgi:CHAD domain-containing protein